MESVLCKEGRICKRIYIMKTCPCKVHPLKPHFYIVKLGYAGYVYLFFLFLLQNIDCGYSLEPIYVLSKNKKTIKHFLTKFSFFTTEKNLCTLHGQVFVMLNFPAILCNMDRIPFSIFCKEARNLLYFEKST